jgi:hypothetical protein
MPRVFTDINVLFGRVRERVPRRRVRVRRDLHRVGGGGVARARVVLGGVPGAVGDGGLLPGRVIGVLGSRAVPAGLLRQPAPARVVVGVVGGVGGDPGPGIHGRGGCRRRAGGCDCPAGSHRCRHAPDEHRTIGVRVRHFPHSLPLRAARPRIRTTRPPPRSAVALPV